MTKLENTTCTKAYSFSRWLLMHTCWSVKKLSIYFKASTWECLQLSNLLYEHCFSAYSDPSTFRIWSTLSAKTKCRECYLKDPSWHLLVSYYRIYSKMLLPRTLTSTVHDGTNKHRPWISTRPLNSNAALIRNILQLKRWLHMQARMPLLDSNKNASWHNFMKR